MPIDLNRQRRTYSYTRVQPRYQEAQVIVDETLDWKNSVRVASDGEYLLSGPSSTITMDGVTIVDGDRVLLRNQDDASQNGIYYFEVTGGNYNLVRASDAVQETLSCGAATYVEEGSKAGKIYILSTTNPITVGSTLLYWSEFSGGGGGTPGGSNTFVQFNDGGSFGGVSGLKFNKTTGALTGTYVLASTGFSGSLTRLTDGTSYLIAGDNVTINTGSKGEVTISSVGGAGGKDYWVSTTAESIYSTGSVAIRGGLSSVDSATDIGADVFFFVSGSITGSGTNDKKAVFGGDVKMSGSLEVSGDQVEITGSLRVTNGISGSLTRLTDDTPYLIAGPNITINTGSNGAVQITGSAGGITGTGTAGYLSAWTSSNTLGDSHIYYWTGYPSITTYRYKGYQNQFVSLNDSVQLVLETDNTTGARVGINSSVPQYPLDVSEGIAGTSTIANFRNTEVSGGTDRGIQMYMGAGNFNPGTFQLLHEWKTDRHYTRFRTTNLSSLAPPTSGPIEDLLVLSSDRKVLVTGSLSVRYDGSSQVGTVVDVQKLDGNQIMWISSSAGSNPIGTDVFMWVSGSRTDNNTGSDKVVFGGDVRVSGSLTIGTGSVFITSNNIQFGSTTMRVEKNGNDMKFFDISNPSGLTLSELAAGGGGGGGSSPLYWTSPTSGFIYATGSVGIGTTNSSFYNLDVYQTETDQNCGVNIETNGAGASTLYLVGGNAFLTLGDPYGAPTNEISSLYRDSIGDLQPMWRIWGGNVTSNMALDTGGVEALRINASQNIGIGTSSPGARVDILSSNAAAGLIVKQGATAPANGVPIIQAKGYGGATVLWVSGSGGIDSRVGIGTTNPRATCMLDVGIKGSTATNNYVGVNAGVAGECGISWSANGSELWKLKRAGNTTDLSLVELNTNNIALLCEYTSGNVGINTSKPEDKLHVDTGNIRVDTAGYGVRLASSPSNGDAQTLDSYYEVTVTSVALRDDTGDYAMAAGYNSLKMTRIGRLVTLSGHLRIDTGTKPSGLGRLKINMTSASPAPPVASNKTAASVWVTSFDAGLTYPIQAYMDTSDSVIYVDGFNAGAYVNLGPYLDSSSDVIVSVTYVAV